MPLFLHLLGNLSFELLSMGPQVNLLGRAELFHSFLVSCDDDSADIVHIDETVSVKFTLLNLFLIESSDALENDVDQLHVEGRGKDRVEAVLCNPEILFRLEVLKFRLVDHTEELFRLLDEVVSEKGFVEANSRQGYSCHECSSCREGLNCIVEVVMFVIFRLRQFVTKKLSKTIM